MKKSNPPADPLVLGVAGGSASGKSAVVRELVRLVAPTRATVVPHDAYYYDQSALSDEERRSYNFDHPRALETDRMVRDVRRLIQGSSIRLPTYDFATNTRGEATRVVEPAPIIILEGILVLAEPGLRALMHLCVFIDVDEEERLARRLRRDVTDRGRTPTEVLAHHHGSVQPMHDRFVEPSRHHAHVIIREGAQNLPAIKSLSQRIENARSSA